MRVWWTLVNSGQTWSHTVKHWSNTGQTFVKHWSNAGQMQVRAIDAANNTGAPSTPAYVFLVDASLPITSDPIAVTAGGDTKGTETNKIIIGVVVGEWAISCLSFA